MTPTDSLEAIALELENATDAPLYAYRQENKFKAVPGDGNPTAKLMFIGEAPGYNEAKKGQPFVGAAGKFLNELLGHIQLEREDVFITNIVKDRPPDNRDPYKAEIAFYAPYLYRQIDIIQPSIIATLGRFAMDTIYEKYEGRKPDGKIGQLHGQVLDIHTSYGMVKLVPLYHPAASLYDETKRDVMFKDFETLGELIKSSSQP